MTDEEAMVEDLEHEERARWGNEEMRYL